MQQWIYYDMSFVHAHTHEIDEAIERLGGCPIGVRGAIGPTGCVGPVGCPTGATGATGSTGVAWDNFDSNWARAHYHPDRDETPAEVEERSAQGRWEARGGTNKLQWRRDAVDRMDQTRKFRSYYMEDSGILPGFKLSPGNRAQDEALAEDQRPWHLGPRLCTDVRYEDDLFGPAMEMVEEAAFNETMNEMDYEGWRFGYLQ